MFVGELVGVPDGVGVPVSVTVAVSVGELVGDDTNVAAAVEVFVSWGVTGVRVTP